MIGLHHDIPAATYHSDDFGAVATLSSSIAKILLDEAPIKAKMAHPRLAETPPTESKPDRVKEIGTAAHKLILGRGRDVVEIEADAYRKDDVKQARADAYAAGKCPILSGDLFTVDLIAARVRAGIADWPDCRGFLTAEPEVVVIADDPSGARLRIMIDALEMRDDATAIIWDLKTGDQSAAPQGLGGRIATMGLDLQAEFYRHVLGLARPDLRRIAHRFLFVENEAPHLMSVVELDGTARAIGASKTRYAIELWNRCLATGEWPGYPTQIVVPDYPAYAHTKWLAREEAYEAMGVRPALPAQPYVTKTLMGAC